MLLPTSGKATVLGYDVVKEAQEVQKRVNMVAGGERMLYYRLTARENLEYFTELYDVPRTEAAQRLDELLALVGLAERQDEPVERFSKGMKQRLQIARGLSNDPQVLLLDEPTLGLDVHIARDLRRFIEDELVRKRKKTVLVTTHYLYEAEEICNRVAFLQKGKILAINTPKNLKKKSKKGISVEIIVSFIHKNIITLLESIRGVKTVSLPESHSISTGGPAECIILIIEDEGIIPRIMDTLTESRTKILSVNIKEPSLEDIFIEMMSGE